jgi:tRNA modification GTPase
VNLDDTIVAIATPLGRGGIGVIRIAGSDAIRIASPMLRLKRDLQPGRAELENWSSRSRSAALSQGL